METSQLQITMISNVSLLQQLGPKKFKLFRVDLIYQAEKFKVSPIGYLRCWPRVASLSQPDRSRSVRHTRYGTLSAHSS